LRGIPVRAARPSVLTSGKFDGVHLAHQALLEMIVTRARAMQAAATVLTFEPHPREYFSPQNAPARLTSLRDKLLQLAQNGVDRVHGCGFDARLAALPADRVVEHVLVRGLGVPHLVRRAAR